MIKVDRPKSHRTGDLGIAATTKFFLDNDWIVNEIRSDYGEDLLVRPAIQGLAEKAQMLLQVKSIGASTARRHVELKVQNMFLWQFRKEPVLLVAWDQRDDVLHFDWLNSQRNPTLFVSGVKRTWSLSNMQLLTPKDLAFFRAELLNYEYADMLADLSSYIESNGGYRSTAPGVVQAKVAATQVGLRLLTQDALLVEVDGEWRVNVDFLLEHLDGVVRHAAGLGNTRRRLLRIGAMSWALFIVSYVWTELYRNAPDDHVLWILANVVEAMVTKNDVFLPVVREAVRELV